MIRPLAALIAAALVPAMARATAMEVAPVVVDLRGAAPTALITIRNPGATPARYQLSAMSWTEPKVGSPSLAPSQDLSFFPPLFQIGPGEERKVRVGATVPPGPAERAWRLFVDELPDATDPSGAGATVRMRTRFALAVFLAPAHPQPSFQVELVARGGGIALVVRNTGNVRVKPTRVSVALLGAAKERLHEVQPQPVTVLAGGELEQAVPVPAELCAKVNAATLAAEIAGEKRNVELALPGGACAP